MRIRLFPFSRSARSFVLLFITWFKAKRRTSPDPAAAQPEPVSYASGSFTVESALLVPLILGTLFLMLYAAAHVHARTVYTGAACETAVTGQDHVPPVFFAHDASLSTSDSETERTVESNVSTAVPVGARVFAAQSEETYKKVEPVRFLHRLSAAKELFS